MGWLSGPAETKEVGASAFLNQIFGGGAAGEALYPEPSFSTFAGEAFGRNELVYSCFDGQTLVSLANGTARPIADVRPGDMVRTHKGKARPVVAVDSRDFDGALYSIRRMGSTVPLLATPEHPMFVGRGTRNGDIAYEWVTVEHLRHTDWLVEPVNDATEDHETYTVERANRGLGKRSSRHWTRHEVPVTDGLLRLIGYFLAEGYLAGDRSVRFAFHEDEREFHDDVIRLMADHFDAPNADYPYIANGRSRVLNFNSSRAAEFFKQFGHGARNKAIPNWILTLPPHRQRHVVDGLWRGDGCTTNLGFNISTASRNLAEGCRLMLLRMGVCASLNTMSNSVLLPVGTEPTQRTLHTLTMTGGNAQVLADALGVPCPAKSGRRSAFIRNGYAHWRIRSLTTTPVTGHRVHNLEVEGDNSYLAGGVAAHNCIMEKATSLPEAPLRVYGGDGLGEPRENHPLRVLMASPNPALTEFELMELTVIHLDLAGNAFWEIILDRLGRPVELWPLRPDRMRIYPRRNGRHEYGYQLGDGKIVGLGTNVIQFKMPNPVDPYLGQAPLRPALRAVALDNEATDFVKSLLQNRAVPGTIIETEQVIDDATATRLEARWNQKFGGARRGGPAFLQKGMKPHPLGFNLKDLEFPDLRTISESRICMTLGVPPILVGAKVGLDRSTFANYHEARSSFWEETLMPLQQRMQQAIVKKLMPYFEGPRPRRTVIKFDNSQVRALRESEGKRWELATQALRAGGITVNQFARQVGLPTTPDGDVYLRPAGVIPTDAGGRPLVELQGPPSADPSAVGDAGDDAPKHLEMAAQYRAEWRAQQRIKASEAKVITGSQRKRFEEDIAEFVEVQRDIVIADLRKSKVTSSYLAAKSWDVQAWDETLSEVLLPHMKQSARSSARRVDKDADVEIMDAYLGKAASGVASGWNQATRDQVAAAARTADWEDSVSHIFELAAGVRATTLAGSLLTEMAGFGAVDTAKRVGFGHKTWNVNSGNARSAHAALDGETVPVGETFSNGANWPGDASLPDDERAGCQCSVTFEEGS